MPVPLPDPALVVLVGASGSGKSTWARERYLAHEVVSSDELRAVVGSGPADLSASADAFALLETIVSARVGRGLTTVVDTLGLHPARRAAWLSLARRTGLGAVAVLMDTPAPLCRERNARRDRPVPARVLADQVRAVRRTGDALDGEGWDLVLVVRGGEAQAVREDPAPTEPERPPGLRVVLQLSRFPWGEDPAAWLRDVARAAEEAGLDGLALMDHLIQIPQVGRAWEPIPEPWVTLGLLAGLGTGLRLGTLVTPVTFRPPGITAKAAATLAAVTGGRAFVGVGAGWWQREHAAYGLPFPPTAQRFDDLERAIETMRALWAPGTKPYDGRRVSLPETTCYPRPDSAPTVVVGGNGERRTLRIAALLGDACNVSSDEEHLARRIAALHAHCDAVGRPREEVEVTVLDVAVVGTDREDTWRRVERLRGRTSAVSYARRHHAGPVGEHRERYARLADRGVGTVFLALPDLAGPPDVERLAGLVG